MSTTYYCYGEKYFCGGIEDRGEKDEIFLANRITKQVSCLPMFTDESCASAAQVSFVHCGDDEVRRHLSCFERE